MNDLYFTVKNKKGSQGRKPSQQASIFAKKPIKRSKHFHFGNKKTIIPIFFVSILWFLYGAGATFARGETRLGLRSKHQGLDPTSKNKKHLL